MSEFMFYLMVLNLVTLFLLVYLRVLFWTLYFSFCFWCLLNERSFIFVKFTMSNNNKKIHIISTNFFSRSICLIKYNVDFKFMFIVRIGTIVAGAYKTYTVPRHGRKISDRVAIKPFYYSGLSDLS